MLRCLAVAMALSASVGIGAVEWATAQPPAEPKEPGESDPPSEPLTPPDAPVEPEESGEPETSTEPEEPESDAPASTDGVPADYQVILGEGWSFAVPPDWQTVLTSAAELGDASIVAQFNDSQKQTVVNLVTQDYDGEGNDYLQQSIATLTDLGFTIHTQQPITIAGLAGIDLEVSLPSDETDTTVRLWQRMIVDDATGFALTCGGPEANLEAAQPICRHILNSFQVTP